MELKFASADQNRHDPIFIVGQLLILLCVLFLIYYFHLTGLAISLLLIVVTNYFLSIPKKRFDNLGIGKNNFDNINVLSMLFLGVAAEFTFQVIINPSIEIVFKEEINLLDFYRIKNNVGFYILMVIYGWVEGGIIEELIYRGFVLNNLMKVLSRFTDNSKITSVISVLIVSIFFGLSHSYQGISGVISTGLFSALLSIVYIKSGKNTFYSIILHGFIDTTAFTIIYLDLNTPLRNLIF